MPFYDFHCPQHGATSAMLSVANRDTPQLCPSCNEPMNRLVAAPRLAIMSTIARQVSARNERSAHEPRRVQRSSCGHTHHGGDSCTPGANLSNETVTDLRPATVGSRPWMLGH